MTIKELGGRGVLYFFVDALIYILRSVRYQIVAISCFEGWPYLKDNDNISTNNPNIL